MGKDYGENDSIFNNGSFYWAYVHNNYEWSAWNFVLNKLEVKLGPFDTKEEAVEAAKKFDEDRANGLSEE
jgi:hypothetical protein